MRHENGIFVLLKGADDSHFPLVLEREYAFLSLSSLCLSFSLILFLPEFSTCLSFPLILLLHEFTIYYFWRMVCCLRFPPLLVYYCECFSRNVSFSLSFCYYVKFYSDSDSDSTLCNSPSS